MKPLLNHAFCLLLIPVSIGLTSESARAQSGAQDGEWRYYAGDPGSTRYSPLDQINPDNVGELEVEWTWKADNFGSRRETRTE